MWTYNGAVTTGEDMNRKFAGSWVKLAKFGVVKPNAFDNGGFTLPENGDFKYYPRELFQVEMEFPEVGCMVNRSGTAFLLSRVPVRQWVVGLTPEVLGARCPANNKFIAQFTRATVESLFNPAETYVTLEQAFKAVSEKSTLTLAFTPVYWLSSDGGIITLWRREIEVGTITKNGESFEIEINDFSMSLMQELKDELKNVKHKIK